VAGGESGGPAERMAGVEVVIVLGGGGNLRGAGRGGRSDDRWRRSTDRCGWLGAGTKMKSGLKVGGVTGADGYPCGGGFPRDGARKRRLR
jgi:hypothetical protein